MKQQLADMPLTHGCLIFRATYCVAVLVKKCFCLEEDLTSEVVVTACDCVQIYFSKKMCFFNVTVTKNAQVEAKTEGLLKPLMASLSKIQV